MGAGSRPIGIDLVMGDGRRRRGAVRGGEAQGKGLLRRLSAQPERQATCSIVSVGL
ncbi:hypothetical protein [Candidatus Methylacidiphilum infernorum]|uniref:hypothetical protein n=1 Tax=Candidatus Methylacidiphilum infernorum TaxID=511746 RepID=UPI0002D42E2E|nr:hypothetical protein [Candidatus Methylacidiphilum infernorum]